MDRWHETPPPTPPPDSLADVDEELQTLVNEDPQQTQAGLVQVRKTHLSSGEEDSADGRSCPASARLCFNLFFPSRLSGSSGLMLAAFSDI